MAHLASLVGNQRKETDTMIAWTLLALLAVAAAKPQLQLQQPLRSQILTSQPLGSQIINAQQIPLANYQTSQLQTLPVNYQTSRVQALPINYQTVQPQFSYQTVQPQVSYQTVQPQVNYQSVPVNTLSTVNYQQLPVQQVQQVRVAQVKPLTQVRTQTIRPSVISSNLAPLQQVVPQIRTVQQHVVPQYHTVQQHVVPQVHSVQVQQRVGVAPQVGILRQVQEVQADGNYAYAFETENGIKAQEEGRTVNQGTDAESSIVQGSYSYTAPDGTPITVNYIADENGFRAEGEHIPKPSEEIQRSLEYLRSLPPRPEDNEGKYVPDRNRY